MSGEDDDPFAVLGMHRAPDAEGALMMRAFVPRASRVWVVDARDGSVVCELPKLHAAGLFAGPLHDRRQRFRYRLRAAIGEVEIEFEDSYQFPLLMREAELDLFKEGNHFQIHRLLGAHPQTVDGVSGVVFAVWAPNARRVSVVGDFNSWDGRRHPMRLRPEYGVWEIFIPRIGIGELYKYEIKSKSGEVLPLKADPCGFYAERPPATASIVYRSDFKWHDEQWMAHREKANARESPISIYEVHLGSWKRARNGQYLTYRELADQLVPYVRELGFTHIELAADFRTSLRWVVGLSADWPVRAHEPLWNAG